MKDIEAVIFDIGNVLVRWQPEDFYDRVIGEINRKKLFSEVDLHGMNEQVDLGKDFKKSIYETADEYPYWRDEVRLWHDRWIEMAQPDIKHSVKLLRALRKNGTPVFALSNFGIGSFDYAKTIYSFLSEFDRYYISGHLGVTKPDHAIYKIVENDCGILPDKLLFTDDRMENIQIASDRRWQTHHFTAPQTLADRFVLEGLLTKEEAKW